MENFKAVMIGIILWCNIFTVMGWSVIPKRHTPVPVLIHKQELMSYTTRALAEYTFKLNEDMEKRSLK